jgi:hypothetical protein
VAQKLRRKSLGRGAGWVGGMHEAIIDKFADRTVAKAASVHTSLLGFFIAATMAGLSVGPAGERMMKDPQPE